MGESNHTVIKRIGLDLDLLNVFSVYASVYECLFTNESVCRRFEIAVDKNTSHVFKRMFGLVEMNSHRETAAVVCDALFVIMKSESWFV